MNYKNILSKNTLLLNILLFLYIIGMSKIIIYHNPRWGKSRNSVGILDQKKVDYKIINYINTPLNIKELKEISKKLELRPKEFIRKGEGKFKELGLSSIIEDDEKIFNAMAKYPKLIERPIIVNQNKACIGRPPERILEII